MSAEPGAHRPADDRARSPGRRWPHPNYENPYGLMAVMGRNVQLHLLTGGLMVLAYVFVLIIGAVAPSVDLFLG
jgi:hypothetical protein